MSTAKHTTEPWKTNGASITAKGDYIATINRPTGDCTMGGEANAARIVACVNACAPNGQLMTLLRRLASKAIDSGATASERVDAHDAAEALRSLGALP